MGIEADIKTLQRHVRELHDRFNMHTWAQQYEPHSTNAEEHKRRKCPKNCKAEHREWEVQCDCGTTLKVNEQTFGMAAKRSVYDGY